jgi:hypothetical protein
MDLRKKVDELGKTAARVLGKYDGHDLEYDPGWERPQGMKLPILVGYSDGVVPKAECIDLAEHHLFVGGVDSGGTIDILRSVADTIISRKDTHLCIADSLLKFSHIEDKAVVATEPATMLDMLKGLRRVMAERLDGKKDIFHKDNIVLIIEEIGEIIIRGSSEETDSPETYKMRADLAECHAIVKEFLITGRQAGLYVIVASQHSPALMPGLLNEFGARIALRSTEAVSIAIVGDNSAAKQAAGYAVLRVGDRSIAVRIPAFCVEED